MSPERSDGRGADHAGQHCCRLAAPRKEHRDSFEVDLEWAPGNVPVVRVDVPVSVVLTPISTTTKQGHWQREGRSRLLRWGHQRQCHHSGSSRTHELGDVVDVTMQ